MMRTPVATSLHMLDPAFIAAVLYRWDQGHDTWQIARLLCEDEAVVCAALRIGREQRRGAG